MHTNSSKIGCVIGQKALAPNILPQAVVFNYFSFHAKAFIRQCHTLLAKTNILCHPIYLTFGMNFNCLTFDFSETFNFKPPQKSKVIPKLTLDNFNL